MQKIDCIIAIGCSHMFGCEHSSTKNDTTPSTTTYVDLIGKKLSLPVFNFSQNGASNQSILRRLLIALEFATKRNLKPFFILQWTEFERYETLVPSAVYRAADWPWIRTNAEIKNKSKDTLLKDWAENFYRLYDTKTLLYETLQSIQHANSLLETQKHPVINCLAEGWRLDGIESHPGFVSSDTMDARSVYSQTLRDWYKEHDYQLDHTLLDKHKVESYTIEDTPPHKDDIVLSLLWNRIEKYNWWFYEHDWQYGLKDYCRDNDLDLGPNGHALESAHEAIYHYLIDGDKFLRYLTQ